MVDGSQLRYQVACGIPCDASELLGEQDWGSPFFTMEPLTSLDSLHTDVGLPYP